MSEPECLVLTLSDALYQLAYDCLEEKHAGWENNEGAFGEFTFDVAARTATLDFNWRFIDSKARKSFESFEDGWFNIEDFVRAQSLDAYVAIETGMVQIEQALLMSDQPDVAAVTSLVGGVMNQYNAVVTEVQKEARSAQ
jgi:hypothetical protein